MVKLLLVICFLNFNLFSQSLKELLDKKISLPYGIINLEFIGQKLERELGFPVKIVTEKKHTFTFSNYKNKSIAHLVSLLMVSNNVQVSFILENDQLKLQLYLPAQKAELIDENREKFNDKKVGLGITNVSLKDATDMIEDLFNKRMIFLNKEMENKEISCELNAVTLEEFMIFLKNNYKIEYEIKDNFIYIK